MKHAQWIPAALSCVACVVIAVTGALAGEWWERPAQASNTTHLWVDGVLGSDHSACTQTEPCATIQAAIDRIPMILAQDIVVHVAAGIYEGGITIADRHSMLRAQITLRGEPQATIWGHHARTHGVTVWKTPGVILENLEITGFEERGLVIAYASPVKVRHTSIVDNRGGGIMIADAAVHLNDVTVRDNGGTGVSCENGWVRMSHLFARRNGFAGVRVEHCRATFTGPGVIEGNYHGLLSVLGGAIDLGGRHDVLVTDNAATPLLADCAGMIAGYRNSCQGDCLCLEVDEGICRAGSAPMPPGRRDPRIDRID